MKNFKKVQFGFLIAAIFWITSVISCSTRSDDDSTSPVNTPSSVINIVNNGTWKVTYYFENNQIKTSTFSGYNFTFGANNLLTANNGTNNYTGIWSVTDSNSNDDNPSDLHFNIGFTTPAQFQELTDDWDIIEKSATEIKLRDVSGGNGGTDLLTFTKN